MDGVWHSASWRFAKRTKNLIPSLKPSTKPKPKPNEAVQHSPKLNLDLTLTLTLTLIWRSTKTAKNSAALRAIAPEEEFDQRLNISRYPGTVPVPPDEEGSGENSLQIQAPGAAMIWLGVYFDCRDYNQTVGMPDCEVPKP